ncbi:MAG: protein kinase [candidate division Zixibacteria bacterium]|nr:protein kinase [candidate division Zixibacteria bacterium]
MVSDDAYDEDKTRPLAVLTKGLLVGHYRILEKIGAGGMGDVYLAEDTELNRKVALKFLPPHLCQEADCRARFKREAQAAAKLSHPNIVTIFEVSEFNGRPFFAMEHIEGESLADLIKKRDHSIEKIIDLSIQICEGLNKAHQAGITHRDIKPSNILTDHDGRAKIVDFGLASVHGSEHLTKTGSTLGTIGYMSPEQARGEEVDARSDLFSFGTVLYEMITGRPPFKAESEIATIKNIVEAIPEPLARYKSGVPDELQRVLSKALTKDRNLRYQHADEILADLRAIQRDGSQNSPRGHQNKKLPLLIGGSVLLLAILIVGYFYMRPEHTPPATKSIAVLPFVDMSPQKDQEYFCDGMTEEIINRLSSIKSLRVLARTSAFSFKGKSEDIKIIGEKLGVQTVLEGSIRKSANHLRITIQLINVADGYHMWSETYDRDVNDIFAIQDDISSSIVSALQLRLAAQEKQQVERRPMDNVDAYECYLKADHEINRFNEEGIRRAIQYLQNGIDLIGDDPLLYSGMASAFYQLVNIGAEQEDYLKKGIELAHRALALNPDLPEAHVVLANLIFWGPYPENMQGVFRQNKLALESNPNEPDALRSLAFNCARMGRTAEASQYLARAETVDPLNTWNRITAGYIYFYDGRYDLALREYGKASQVDQFNPALQFFYAWVYALTGQKDSAFLIIDRMAQTAPGNALTKFGFMLKYGLQNDKEKAYREMTPELQITCRRDSEWSYIVASMFALFDNKEESLDWLENAVNRGFINYKALQRDPFLKNVRGEKRFNDLLERAKYEWEHFEV